MFLNQNQKLKSKSMKKINKYKGYTIERALIIKLQKKINLFKINYCKLILSNNFNQKVNKICYFMIKLNNRAIEQR